MMWRHIIRHISRHIIIIINPISPSPPSEITGRALSSSSPPSHHHHHQVVIIITTKSSSSSPPSQPGHRQNQSNFWRN
ncbi:hypothetical protein CASFOL_009345 [Castilleja foliolosa]|uniref:Uncharacterized protein n=1 Tax=Castilleja foliolosa TaxID=1961234 RepID=A0ABD3DYD1_9LAMI